jgi:anti-sigma factor RsiW
MHLNEEDLVLHYYGELDAAEEAEAASHLGDCGACHARYTRLQRVLATIDAAPAPDLADGFERSVWARLEPELGHRRRWLSWLEFAPGRVLAAAVVLILLAGAFFAGRVTHPAAPAAVAGTAAAGTPFRERVLLSDLGEHLDRSQMMLVELVSGDGDLNVRAERERAEQLVSANRLYRQTAAATGNAALADVLDELERVLIDVAAHPDAWSVSDLDEVRDRIDTKGLLFKVRVLSSDVRERQKAAIRMRAGQSS